MNTEFAECARKTQSFYCFLRALSVISAFSAFYCPCNVYERGVRRMRAAVDDMRDVKVVRDVRGGARPASRACPACRQLNAIRPLRRISPISNLKTQISNLLSPIYYLLSPIYYLLSTISYLLSTISQGARRGGRGPLRPCCSSRRRFSLRTPPSGRHLRP